MIRIALKTQGGSLEIHGPWPSRQVLLILSRGEFKLDDPLMARLTDYFCEAGFTVGRYESAQMGVSRTINPKLLKKWPKLLQRLAKGWLLLMAPNRWWYFSKKNRRHTNTLEYRIESLRKLIRDLGPEREVTVMARSVNARVASLLADELHLKKVVCLGYPFQHPERGPEPERYAHLRTVRTPLLIVQGTRDAYGGREILDKYAFAAGTRVEFLETDHHFTLDEKNWDEAMGIVRDFLASEK